MRKLLPVVLIATLMISCKKENDNPNELNSTDKNFLIQTYLVTKEEIRLGQLAINKTNHPPIQNFGQRIIADYKAAQADLKEVANKLHFALTDTVTLGMQSTSSLNELNGYFFDTAYIHSRARSQMNTLGLFQNELNNGNNTYLKYYFLNKYIDKVRSYYQEAESLARSL